MQGRAGAATTPSALLEEVSSTLASSLDYDETLRRLTDLIVSRIADWSAVASLEADGTIVPFCVSAADPSKSELAQRLRRPFRRSTSRHGIGKVVRTGEAELVADVDDEFISMVAADRDHLESMRQEGLQSYMAVPLRARGQLIGVLLLVTTRDSGRRYDERDLELAQGIAQRAALAIDNARLLREAQEANRLKDEFLVTLSHELRTPLNSIVGWAQLLRHGAIDEETKSRAIETIERNARLQARLVSEILDLSRILSGKVSLEPAAIDLVAIVAHAVETLRPQALAQAVRIRSRYGTERIDMNGDPGRVEQVFWNLLHNALKYTPENGTIDVSVTRDGGDAVLVVSDTGRGIAPDFLPHVFEKFRQEEGQRRAGGLGIGLAIAQHLVQLHRGAITVASAGVGQGATFTVRLPITAPGGYHAPGEARDEWPGTARLDDVRVLAVDGDADSRDLIGLVLTQSRAVVRTAPSVEDAVAQIAKYRPTVVLCAAAAVAGSRGDDLLRAVRGLEDLTRTPVRKIYVSAHAAEGDVARAPSLGYDGYLTKPILAADLVRAVRG